ncbi:MAG: hypothetical protein H6R17_2741 [Proteobacteria bacterium]|nr:hypothetical protein [Pseudomonadota bacterium]
MIASTTFTIDGYDISESKGLVRGIVVRSPTISQGFFGGLKNVIGGKIGSYTTMCEQTRSQAYDDMVDHAKALGANAIVGVRYDASSVEPRGGAVEVLCYGTAVVIAKRQA